MTMIDGRMHRLTLGELVLSEGFPFDYPYKITTLGDDVDFGNPESFDVTIPSQMLDGSDVRTTSHGNREIFLRVKVEAPDGVALAQGEAALMAELGKRNVLAWTPPAPVSPTTVFQVLTSRLEVAFSDVDELRLTRVYGIRLTCKPFGRSVDEVITPAASSAVSPVTVVVDEMNSATGWTSPQTITVADSRLRIRVPTFAPMPAYPARHRQWGTGTLTRTGAIDMSATPYLVIDARIQAQGWPPLSGPSFHGMTVKADETPLLLLSITPSPIAGFRRFTYFCPDPSVTTLLLEPLVGVTWDTNEYGLRVGDLAADVDRITRTNQPPPAGTARQTLRTVSVVGSARTEGSLSIAASTALGDVLVYTSPELGAGGYQPNIMRWVAEEVDADPASVSGRVNTNESIPYDVPVSLLPKGGYSVVARFSGSSSEGDTILTASTMLGTNQLSPTATLSKRHGMPAGMNVVALGGLMLPPVDAPDGSAAVVRFQLSRSNGSIHVEEIWLFHMGEDAALTMVNCGAGTPAIGGPASHLWIESASLESPNPRVWIGSQADRTDARHPGSALSAFGVHKFPAGGVGAFVVTTNALAPDIEFRHTPNWHTNAAS